MDGMADFPMLENLASSSKVLIAEAIRTCSVDRDEVLEAVIASLGAEVDLSMNDKPESTGAEQEGPQQEDDATRESSPELFDASLWVEQIKQLTQALEVRDAEILHWKGKVGYVQNEVEVKFTAAQDKFDELQARFLEQQEKLEICQEEAEWVLEEHAEYELIIRRAGGKTISEVEGKVKELMARCSNYKRQYGAESWQLQEQVGKLKRVAGLYKTILARHLKLARLVSEDAGPSSSSNPDSSSRIVDRHSREFLDRVRRLSTERG